MRSSTARLLGAMVLISLVPGIAEQLRKPSVASSSSQRRIACKRDQWTHQMDCNFRHEAAATATSASNRNLLGADNKPNPARNNAQIAQHGGVPLKNKNAPGATKNALNGGVAATHHGVQTGVHHDHPDHPHGSSGGVARSAWLPPAHLGALNVSFMGGPVLPRIIFAGDSVMLQLFDKVVNLHLLGEPSLAELKRMQLSDFSHVRNEDTKAAQSEKPLECYEFDVQWQHGVSVDLRRTHVCFFMTGRASGLERIPITHCHHAASTSRGLWNADLGDAVACLQHVKLISSGDVLVVNAGVHHSQKSTLQANVNHFVDWHSAAFPNAPCTLWRQTLPQHFPTENGTYSKVFAASDLKTCLPLHLPAWTEQWFNDAVDGIINKTRIPIIKLWREFSSSWNMHAGINVNGVLDCTHWADPPGGNNQVMVRAAQVVVSAIRSECRRDPESHNYGPISFNSLPKVDAATTTSQSQKD